MRTVICPGCLREVKGKLVKKMPGVASHPTKITDKVIPFEVLQMQL